MTQTKAQLIDGKSAEIEFSGGSASAPAISFTGDTNTGVYSPGADQLAISTNGTGRLFVDANGRVGVGTASPTSALHIDVASGEPLRFRSRISGSNYFAHVNHAGGDLAYVGAGGGAALNSGTTSDYAIRANQGALLFATNGNFERMRLDSSGRLGLGTSSPTSILHCNYATATDTYIRTTNSAGTNGFDFGVSSGGEAWVFNRNNTNMYLGTNSAQRVTITAGGNVGIGTTDFAPASSYYDDLVVKNATAGTGCGLTLISNATNGFSAVDFADTDAAGRGRLTYSHADDSLRVDVAGNEAFRVDSSRRLLVGTSTAFGAAASELLQVANANGGKISLLRNDTSIASGNEVGVITWYSADGNTQPVASIACFADGDHATDDKPGRLVFSTTADGASSPTERMKIDKNGTIAAVSTSTCVDAGTTLPAAPTYYIYRGRHSATAGSPGTGTICFTVLSNGNVQNTNNSYGAISDIKLKENIVDANSQWDDLKALQVRNYNFKEGQTHTQIGLIAQEAELVSPGLVSESPDLDEDGNDLGTVTKSVNYSVLYMKAVKALQEAMERIEVLEAKVNALEGN